MKLQTDLTKLRKEVEPIELVSVQNWNTIYKEMTDFLYNEKHGVGLAAPQVELDLPIIIICEDGKKSKMRFLINPVIVSFDSRLEIENESCLSFPGMTALAVKRYRSVEIEAIEYKNGKFIKFRMLYTGLNARIAQHEIDHLEGLEMFDRSEGMKQNLFTGGDLYRPILMKGDVIFINQPPFKHLYNNNTLDVTEEQLSEYTLVGIYKTN